MRKLNKGRIFSRPKNQREAMFSSMAASLFLHGKITTTEAKAKELRGFAERCITRGKENTLANRRVLAKVLPLATVKKLMSEISPSFAKRKGGYTRIAKLGPRPSDGARMAIIELVK